MRRLLPVLLALLVCAAPAQANTSHAGWPHIDGMLLMNKLDQSRALNGQPGADPFDGTDPSYSCDGLHQSTTCIVGGLPFAPADLPCASAHAVQSVLDALNWSPWFLHGLCEQDTISTVPDDIGHNELLGGHGSDHIQAGPRGDVLWGDYKPSGQPTTQSDVLLGGAGKDFIYAGHGRNVIRTGGGDDVIHAHFGHGSITCTGGSPIVYLSRKSRKRYRLKGCRRISYFTLGY